MEALKDKLEHLVPAGQRLTANTIRKRVPELDDAQIEKLVGEGFLVKSYSIRDPNENTELDRKNTDKELEFFKKAKPRLRNEDTQVEYTLEELSIVSVYSLANAFSVYKGLEPIRTERLQDVVVFACDLVSFSEALSSKQLAQYSLLRKEIVGAATEVDFRANEFFAIPSGDGYFLVINIHDSGKIFSFIDRLVTNIAKSLVDLPMRIGVHAGPLYWIEHKDGRMNAIGNSINISSRIMSFGDKGHVLISEDFYNLKIKGTPIQNNFTPIGKAQDKHGNEYKIVNYSHGEIGNKAKPSKIE